MLLQSLPLAKAGSSVCLVVPPVKRNNLCALHIGDAGSEGRQGQEYTSLQAIRLVVE